GLCGVIANLRDDGLGQPSRQPWHYNIATMNPRLNALHPYPFEKLRRLMADTGPSPGIRQVGMSIGEPRHATPSFIREAMCAGLDGLASYPATRGNATLREG